MKIANCLFVILLLGSVIFAADPADIARDLQSGNRAERLKAIVAASKIKPLPKELVAPVVQFARREMQATIEEQDQPVAKASERIPLTGEETPLVKVKAKPASFVDREIVICGTIAISDYWNYGYSEAETTHFSLSFSEVDQNGAERGESVTLYLPRKLGQAFADRLSSVASRNRDSSMVVRVKAVLDSNYYEGPDNWNLLTMRDWQFLEPGGATWSPWNLDHSSIAAVVLSKAGRDSIPSLVACVIDEKTNGDELVDAAGRSAALSGLVLMDKKDRERAYSIAKKGYKKLKSDNAKRWAEMLGSALSTAAAK